MKLKRIITLGTLLVLLGLPSNGLAHPGWGIAADSEGNIFFTDIDRLTIWKRLPDGTLQAAVTGVWTHHIFVDGQDNLFYEREEYRGSVGPYYSFWKLSPTGEQTLLIPPTLDRTVYYGENSVVDATGNIYFPTGRAIIKRSPDGTRVTLAGSETSGHQDGQGTEARFTSINAMTMGPDAAIYVTDGDAVRKITLDGVVTTIARGLLTIPPDDPFFDDGGFNDLYGLSVDEHGTVYVAYHGNRRLLQVTPAGTVSEYYHAVAPWSPMGVAAVGEDLYILETGWLADIGHFGPRLRMRSSDGTITTLLTLGNVDTGSQDESPSAEAIRLHNTPNPFQDRTTISYDLQASVPVALTIYDSAGRQVKRLVESSQKAGHYHVVWDGTDDAGRRVGSGVYLCRISVGAAAYTHSLVLIR